MAFVETGADDAFVVWVVGGAVVVGPVVDGGRFAVSLETVVSICWVVDGAEVEGAEVDAVGDDVGAGVAASAGRFATTGWYRKPGCSPTGAARSRQAPPPARW